MKTLIIIPIIFAIATLGFLKFENTFENNPNDPTILKTSSSWEVIEQRYLGIWLNTNTSKKSIRLSDVLDGWPWKDWIPSINTPKFMNIKEAKDTMGHIDDNSQWISVEIDWEARFYPYNILVWHEIVNDSIWDNFISVTFCPLCWSAIVYERKINWTEVLFWVSWKLYESNLLMYDNQTESLWSQSLWEALVGDYIWKELKVIKSNLMTLKEFETNYTSWVVLSDKTWFFRNYWFVPYWDYNTSDDLIFPVKNKDLRFKKKELFYIINDWNESLAFLFKDLREAWKAIISVWDILYNATFKDWIVTVTNNNKEIPWYYEMWFSWVTHNIWNKNVWSK